MSEVPSMFFVVGLPRSRTAWLANLFTYGPAFCFHDEIVGIEDMAHLARHVHEEGYEHVGFSDSGNALRAAQLMEAFPHARWIVVSRPRGEALDSFVRYFTANRYPGMPAPGIGESAEVFRRLDRALRDIARSLPRHQFRSVDFGALEWEEPARGLWEFIAPGAAWSSRRWQLLHGLRINTAAEKKQVNADHVRQLLEVS